MIVPYPESLTPPQGYGQLEAGLFRARSRIDPTSIPFLKRLGLRLVLNLGYANEEERKVLRTFCETQGAKLEAPVPQMWAEGGGDLVEELMKWSLELILSRASHPVLILDSAPDYLGGRLIGCLRRMQGWPMSSIMEEYWSFRSCCSSYDENLWWIERFDSDLVTFSREDLPPSLSMHIGDQNRAGTSEEVQKIKLLVDNERLNEKMWLLDVDDD